MSFNRPMPASTARANAKKSAVRAHVEHVFSEKARMGLFVRTIGLARATTKIGLANLTHNMRRLLWLERRRMTRRSSPLRLSRHPRPPR